MTKTELGIWLHEKDIIAGMNELYHSTMSWRWAFMHIVISLLGASIVLVTILAASKKQRFGKYTLPSAILSFIVLTFAWILPFHQWSSEYEILAYRWSLQRRHLERVEYEYRSLRSEDDVPAHVLARTLEIEEDARIIGGDEPPQWTKLLRECYEIQLKRIYGDSYTDYLPSDNDTS